MSSPPRDPERAPSGDARLRIEGDLEHGQVALGFDDLAALPAEHQVPDVGVFASGVRGAGVRLAAVIERAAPRPAARYANLSANEGRYRASLFRAVIAELAIVVYARDGRPIAREEGGPFRLVLPGFHDERRDIGALERIAFEREPGPDERRDPLLEGELPPIAGAFYPPELVEPETSRPRTWIVPPRFAGEPRIPSPSDGAPQRARGVK
jgi:DMSO/TMAO reductase YedYZ molybdopterin-dependent catalytic subunit